VDKKAGTGDQNKKEPFFNRKPCQNDTLYERADI